MKANTIEAVIKDLDLIIENSEKTENRLGYFASIYKMVTEQVRDEIDKEPGESIFEDPARMEKLDVIFANRYLEAYSDYIEGESTTKSWQVAFTASKKPSAIIIQHLLLGMNAHIGLDLGIAAALVCRELNQPIESLHNDFNSINAILAALVGTVEKELSIIWSPLKFFLRIIPFKLDRNIISFSMDLARDSAWEFAVQIFNASDTEIATIIRARDNEVAIYGADLAAPPWWLSIFIFLIRLGEKSSVAENIRYLNGELRIKIMALAFNSSHP